MSPFAEPLPDRVRRYFRARLLLLRSIFSGLSRVAWMLLTSPLQVPFALAVPIRLRAFQQRAGTVPELERISPGIWRAPASAPGVDPEPPLVVLQYPGSAESVHAAYASTRALFAAEPRLQNAIHYVFEAPLDKGAYYGPERFAARLWERVEPIVAHYDRPFVLVGMSRGGLVALEHALRIVQEHGKVASVLSLSAPIEAPRTLPRAIASIAGFVEALEGFQASLASVPRLLRLLVERQVRLHYVQLVALVLRFHGVFSLANLERHVLDVRDHGITAGTLKAAREFRLLVRTNERKLQLLAQLVARALANQPSRLAVALVWGADDRWIDAESCRRRFEEAANRLETPVELCAAVVSGQGHLLGGKADRATGHPFSPWFTRAANEALRLASLRDVQAEAAREVENELHLANDVRREHE